MLLVKTGYVPQQQAQQPHLHIHQQQHQQQLAAELASRRHLTNQQFIENELAKIQQEKLRIQRQQETLAQKVNTMRLHFYCSLLAYLSTVSLKQVALLWQRDRATLLSVEILQLQNIPFEN